jgi:galactose mutarotase-like enzyme
MLEAVRSFPEEIEANRGAEVAPSSIVHMENGYGLLNVRRRGCFITDCELTGRFSNERVSVLHSDPNLNVPKLTASHVMSPVGPSEGMGGQHGFPRWADYHEFLLEDGPKGERRVALQAKRSDNGLALAKTFELAKSALSSQVTIYNSEPYSTWTSIGEHYYFALEEEQLGELRVKGITLDDLLGDGAEKDIMEGKSRFLESLPKEFIIDFPDGHNVILSAEFTGDTDLEPGMLVWHKPGSPSICFEPTVGFSANGQNNGVELAAHSSATLATKIELL